LTSNVVNGFSCAGVIEAVVGARSGYSMVS
jgi:hypothetical protein